MINGKSILGLIPARGGSKGVPHKNIRSVAGKPLLAWTIEEAHRSKYIDRLILSSDDSSIIDIAKKWGCEVPFRRPANLALDNTPGIEPVLHAIKVLTIQYDYVIVLQPTSPLRNREDIDKSLELCEQSNSQACVSVVEARDNPYWMYLLGEDNRLRPFAKGEQTYARRQDLPKVYALNGAVYLARCAWLQNHRTFLTDETIAYIMPLERSLDLDSEFDFKILNALLHDNPT